MFSNLSTDRVLVMSRIEGVPLLDAAGMEAAVRTEAMAALVMAYGVQARAAALLLGRGSSSRGVCHAGGAGRVGSTSDVGGAACL